MVVVVQRRGVGKIGSAVEERQKRERARGLEVAAASGVSRRGVGSLNRSYES